MLLDLAMPVMNGLSAAREIRKLLPNASILLVTSYCLDYLELPARAYGIQFVVPKSEADTKLPAAIEQCLKKAPQVTASNEATLAAAAGANSASTVGTPNQASCEKDEKNGTEPDD